MHARVDLAISPPGLIRGARCHTLILDDDGLAIIHVCRGWRIGFAPRGALAARVAAGTLSHLRTKAEAATGAITAATYREHVAGKGSARFALADVTAVGFEPERLALRFKGKGKLYGFEFERPEAEAATAFAAALASRCA